MCIVLQNICYYAGLRHVLFYIKFYFVDFTIATHHHYSPSNTRMHSCTLAYRLCCIHKDMKILSYFFSQLLFFAVVFKFPITIATCMHLFFFSFASNSATPYKNTKYLYLCVCMFVCMEYDEVQVFNNGDTLLVAQVRFIRMLLLSLVMSCCCWFCYCHCRYYGLCAWEIVLHTLSIRIHFILKLFLCKKFISTTLNCYSFFFFNYLYAV